MKRIILSLAFIAGSAFAWGQVGDEEREAVAAAAQAAKSIAEEEEEEEEALKDGWKIGGNVAILFNQAAFNSDWLGGGTTNYSLNLTGSYGFDYRRDKFTWSNRIMADYGFTKLKSEDFERKTNDRLEFNSIAGRQIKESNWYYSFFLNFRTQFAPGYIYHIDDDDFDPEVMWPRERQTEFLSPAYLSFGPGMMWKKNENLYVNIAPATPRFLFVNKDYTTIPGYEDGDYFGVDAGKGSLFQFGAFVGAYGKFDLMEDVSMENILNMYSNYLDKPQNIFIDYTMNLVMTVNKYISANLVFQAIYDPVAVKSFSEVTGFQIREALGVGANFNL